MGRRWLPIGTIVLLFCGVHVGFAQRQKDAPATKESADWERASEGLKKAKPMPDPSHAATPKTATPSGGLQGKQATKPKKANRRQDK